MTDSTELTTRDVFAQLDRRLTRIGDDLRDFRNYVEIRFSSMESHLDAKIDRDFRWLLGITMASWLSLMTTLLLK